mmetsp:Transcript_3769/g.8397  ORF Transcript_3769/g.8397 Transcript_3769/m.8397 type:complete len:307 (-) Transcript_3769:2512-3432(-)
MDKLCKILNTVNIVMGRRRDKRHTLLTRPQRGNVFRNLGSGQLSTLARLGTLRHLNLELLSRHQELGGYTESARGDLMNVRVGRVAILESSKVGEGRTASLLINIREVSTTYDIFSTLSRVGLSTNAIDGNGKGLMSLATECSKGHGTSTETLHNLRNWFHFLNGNTFTIRFKVKQIANVGQWRTLQTLLEDFIIGSIRWLDTVVLLFIAICRGANPLVESNSIMEKLGQIGGVDMILSLLGNGLVVPVINELGLLGRSLGAHHDSLAGNVREVHAANAGGGALEGGVDDLFAQSHGFKDLCSLVR